MSQHLMASDRRRLGDPPTPEELLAYTRGELSADEEARLQERLVCYPELVRTITEPFPTEGAEPGDPDFMPDEELGKHWASMQSRLRRKPAEGARVVQFWRYSAVAAALIAVVLGAMLWVVTSRAPEPRLVWEEQVLMPDGRRGPESQPQTLTAQGESIVLIAPLIGAQKFDHYRLEITNQATARVIWSTTGVQPHEENNSFLIIVPRRFFRPGTYEIVVYGVSGDREERVTTYSLLVPRSNR
ncbi:MAG TPA: hypothetical protein VNA69_04465 [Thermoanaerobaculia bacterium]|nr:hypothetical protein [Thermoanaerobaculia bacterium]